MNKNRPLVYLLVGSTHKTKKETYPIDITIVHAFKARFEQTVTKTEGRGSKLVENGGIAPVVIPFIVTITLKS